MLLFMIMIIAIATFYSDTKFSGIYLYSCGLLLVSYMAQQAVNFRHIRTPGQVQTCTNFK